MRPTPEEIQDQLDQAAEAAEGPSQWPGMTYEQGVSSALRWVTGDSEDAPMED